MNTVFRDAEGPCLAPQGSVVCIGAFDGVHRGHQAVLARVRERAWARGFTAIALTFEPLPRQHFQGRAAIPRLSAPGSKICMLREHVDLVVVLRFDAGLAATSAEDFATRVLSARLAAQEVWVGPGFRFGHGRRGDADLLRERGATLGFTTHTVDPVFDADEGISSSRIRAALAADELALAGRLLGRPFAMGGRVVHGAQLGRKLGYPTANLPVRWGGAPVHGIFAARVHGAGLRAWPAVASLGTRPTIGGVELLLEAHLFDFDGDLYGHRLSVEFVRKLREERRFDSIEALRDQIHRDAEVARAILVSESEAP